MDYILLRVPRGSEYLAKYILGFFPIQNWKNTVAWSTFPSPTFTRILLMDLLPLFHQKCKWAQSFRMLSGNACLICRGHHLWGGREGGKETSFSSTVHMMSHKIQWLEISTFVLKDYLRPVQIPFPLNRGISQWCINSWVRMRALCSLQSRSQVRISSEDHTRRL